MGDDPGFADPGHDELSAAGQTQVDGAVKGLGQATENRGKRGDLLAENAFGFLLMGGHGLEKLKY